LLAINAAAFCIFRFAGEPKNDTAEKSDAGGSRDARRECHFACHLRRQNPKSAAKEGRRLRIAMRLKSLKSKELATGGRNRKIYEN
jgi:hypothetical protein